MSDRPSPLSRPVVTLLTFATLAGGLALWLHYGSIEFVYGWQRGLWLAAVGAALLVALSPSRLLRPTFGFLARHRTLGPRGRQFTTLLVGVAGAVISAMVFFAQGGDPQPSVCDEYSYLIQAQMLSRLRLWGPGHELPEFFTTFQLVASPVYGSIYLPGTALWLAPWAWFDRVVGDGSGALLWPGPLIAMGVGLGLTYRCTAELLDDDRIGLLAAVILLCTPTYRASGMMLIGQSISTMFATIIVYAFLKWRAAARDGEHGTAWIWATLAGIATAWGMLSRPMDVLAYALPVFALVAAPLVMRRPVDGVAWRLRASSAGLAVAMAVPFALLLMPLNKAMSGSYFQTSFGWYAENYLPGTSYGLTVDRPLDAVPWNEAPHYQLSYRSFTRRFIHDHAELPTSEFLRKRFREQLMTATPHALMLATALSPLLLLALRPKRTWRFALLLGAPWALAAALYVPYGFYLGQYAVATMPSMSAAIASGALAFTLAAATMFARGAEPSARAALSTGVLVVGSLLALSTRGIRGMASVPREDWYQIPELRKIDAAIETQTTAPAVIFLTPPPRTDPLEAEPVYNLNVLTPDEADRIRAHDLGWRNSELVAYYAERDPSRQVYHFDRRDRTLTHLGTAGELAADAESIEAMRRRFDELSAWWRPFYREQIDRYDQGLPNAPVPMPILEEYQPASTRPSNR